MGFLFSKAFNLLASKSKDSRIIMLGLDNAGKTTCLYKLKTNEAVHTMPTVGFNCESVEFKGINFTVWDIGGQDKIRVLWRHYYDNTDAIIYLIDSNDSDRIEESKEELDKMLAEDSLSGAPLLVFANKQDLKGATSVEGLTEKLELSKIKNRKWLVQGSNCISGQGICEGLDWLAKELLKKK